MNAGSSGAIALSTRKPAPSSSAVAVSASPRCATRLFNVPNTATSSAETAPTTTPSRMPVGTPPTTSATPGNTASPSKRSRGEKRVRVSHGSTSAVNGVASAMQVAATDAFASLIAP